MNRTGVILFSLLAFSVLSCAVRADIAPPTMSVNVTYNGSPINGTFYSTALICTNSSGSGVPGQVPQLNISYYDPAKGCYWTNGNLAMSASCAESACSFEYFSPSTFRMAFYLPGLNKTFITDEFNSTAGFDYDAMLHQDGTATIVPAASPTPPPSYSPLAIFLLALLLTIAIELTVAFIYLKLAKVKKAARILLFVAAANIISLPILWFVFLPLLYGLGLILGEAFAVVFEGLVVYYFNRKSIKLRSAMLMSLIMNIASAVIGGIILLMLLA
jgi:hypothetical protein